MNCSLRIGALGARGLSPWMFRSPSHGQNGIISILLHSAGTRQGLLARPKVLSITTSRAFASKPNPKPKRRPQPAAPRPQSDKPSSQAPDITDLGFIRIGFDPNHEHRWFDLRNALVFRNRGDLIFVLAFLVWLGSVVHWAFGEKPSLLNTETFTPFNIASKEAVSSTAFILTLHPKHPLTSQWFQAPPRPYDDAWDHGLWSVEIKQPQLQIARSYTPLPPLDATDAASHPPGTIRLLIRRMEGGEVSRYLSGLKTGDTVELRGPHLGFNLRKRLGAAGEVVFLAGGTGIAAGMQAIRAMGGEGVRMTVVWANRRREDCVGCEGLSSDGEERVTEEGKGVMGQLAEMKRRLGEGLRVRCVVDEEESFIGDRDVQRYLLGDGREVAEQAVLTVEAGACSYHSDGPLQRLAADQAVERCFPGMLQRGTDSSEGKGPGAVQEMCDCGSPGRKLVLISGPDGFIQAYGGRKKWEGGLERQGPVGGILGTIKQRYPELFKEWMVLKL